MPSASHHMSIFCFIMPFTHEDIACGLTPNSSAIFLIGSGPLFATNCNLSSVISVCLPIFSEKDSWAIWYAMSPREVEAFLNSPYAKVVDAKMWLFFAHPSRLTISVLGILVVGSVFVRDLWCRYLCPYGALVGVLGRLAPFKVPAIIQAASGALCGERFKKLRKGAV